MRAFTLISVAEFSVVVFALPCPTRTSCSDAPAKSSAPIPGTRVFATSPIVQNVFGTPAPTPGGLKDGLYYIMGLHFEGRRLREWDGGRLQRKENAPPDPVIDGPLKPMDEVSSIPIDPLSSSTQHTGAPASTSTSKNLIPHWDFKKHSIAAACIFVAVVIIAFIILLVLYSKKVKLFFQRHWRETKGSQKPPKYDAVDTNNPASTSNERKSRSSSRGTFSFDFARSRSPSPGFVVEEDPKRGSVTRVYRASKTDAHDLDPIPCPPRVSIDEGRVVIEQPKPLVPAGNLKASAQKPVIVVPSPLAHVKPMSATREGFSEDDEALPLYGDYEYDGSTLQEYETAQRLESGSQNDMDSHRLSRVSSTIATIGEALQSGEDLPPSYRHYSHDDSTLYEDEGAPKLEDLWQNDVGPPALFPTTHKRATVGATPPQGNRAVHSSRDQPSLIHVIPKRATIQATPPQAKRASSDGNHVYESLDPDATERQPSPVPEVLPSSYGNYCYEESTTEIPRFPEPGPFQHITAYYDGEDSGLELDDGQSEPDRISNSNRTSLLPRIPRSSSPLFSFDAYDTR